MKVLMLETFEGIPKPPRGTGPAIPQGVPQTRCTPGAGEGKDAKIYALPGGSFLVDWGDPGVQDGTLAFVGAANVKFALVQLTAEEKGKLLK